MNTRKRREKLQSIAEFRASARKRAVEIIPSQMHLSLIHI